MIQFSGRGEETEIEVISGELLFIDPLYFDEIAKDADRIKGFLNHDRKKFVRFLEETFFPYGGGTLFGYKIINQHVGTYRFNLNSMSDFDDDNEEMEILAIQKDITTLGVDSASFLLLDMVNFENLLPLIKYDELCEVSTADNPYFQKINQLLGNKGWGYIVTPGIDSGYVFEGDGSYLIN